MSDCFWCGSVIPPDHDHCPSCAADTKEMLMGPIDWDPDLPVYVEDDEDE